MRSGRVYISEELRREILRLAQEEDPIPEWGPSFVYRRYRYNEIAAILDVSESLVARVVKEMES